MNKSILLLTLLLAANVSAGSLQDQLNAVKQAEQAGKTNTDAKLLLEQEEKAKALKLKQAIEKQRYKNKLAAQALAKADKAAALEKADKLVAAQNAERLADKSRENDYEDRLRNIEIMRLEAKLAKDQAVAARADDYIDAELNKDKAKTDTIQAEADATRHLSKGTQNLLESVGEAAENESSRLW